jgi:hypothetical protein
MAIFKKGILGGFSGKVGTVIGFNWKGRDVMRRVPTHVHDPQTDAQRSVRQRFSLVNHFCAACLPTVQVGFAANAGNISEYNVAVRENYNNGCIQGTLDNFSLDYSRVALSHGQHVNPTGINAAMSGDGSNTINVTWTDNSSTDQSIASTDIVMICVFNPTLTASTSNNGDFTRRDQIGTISYPATWSGHTVEVFVITRSADGQLMSPTAYVGSVTLN